MAKLLEVEKSWMIFVSLEECKDGHAQCVFLTIW
jgi:hypothetical protein